MTLAVLDLCCATNEFPELCTLGFLEPSGLLAAFRSAYEKLKFSTTFLHLANMFCTVAEEIAQLGETPQEQILRPAALHTTGQCESRETCLHTNIPISRAPLNYAGERKSPISLATQQRQLMACVAVIRQPFTLLTQLPSPHALGLQSSMFPETSLRSLLPIKTEMEVARNFGPRGLHFRTECQAPDLVGPGAHNLDQVLESDTVVAVLHGT